MSDRYRAVSIVIANSDDKVRGRKFGFGIETQSNKLITIATTELRTQKPQHYTTKDDLTKRIVGVVTRKMGEKKKRQRCILLSQLSLDHGNRRDNNDNDDNGVTTKKRHFTICYRLVNGKRRRRQSGSWS